MNHSATFSEASLDQMELFFALVGPIGVDMDRLQADLAKALRSVGYTPYVIHITKSLEQMIDTDKVLENADNNFDSLMGKKIAITRELCKKTGQNDILSAIAIAEISKIRGESAELRGKRAYIIRQIKRPHELSLLKKVYGKQLIQISAALNKEDRLRSLKRIVSKDSPVIDDDSIIDICNKIIKIDEDEDSKTNSGQNVGKIYHEADFFVGVKNNRDLQKNITRFIDALFGKNEIGPTRDEYGSYLAVAASLRSCDLSRQIGAAIMDEHGSVIALGCNEAPKAGGGQYWSEQEVSHRDVDIQWEGNKDRINKIIRDCSNRISNMIPLDDSNEAIEKEVRDALKDSLISDITEFGRMTHAEMSAICEAARLGIPVRGSTMYATTFPCHNCAKHIIAAGIEKVVYIEPYLKSRALDLHSDSISTSNEGVDKVNFLHFEGISPKKYRDIFQKRGKRRSKDGNINVWHESHPMPRIEGANFDVPVRERKIIEALLPKLKEFEQDEK